MGIFNKLKNALFEEEEIEIERTPEKVVIKEEPTEYKSEPPKKEIPLENERELFKAENTFKFPEFDEEEFVTNYEPPKEEKKPSPNKISYDKIKPITYDPEPRKPVNRENYTRREKNTSVEKEKTPKTFRPSPVISPVYGILDKNYKKEDFIEFEKKEKAKKKIDVDLARKKAFGSLEEDIEKTLNKPMKEFLTRNPKNIDDLLNDSIDEEITLSFDPQNTAMDLETTKELQNFSNHIEEEFKTSEIDIKEFDEEEYGPKIREEQRENKEEFVDENTLENDLFDLIDSMYDNREDEEK